MRAVVPGRDLLMRVIGVDWSISATGFADYTTDSGLFVSKEFGLPRAATEKGVQPTLAERHTRMRHQADQVIAHAFRMGEVPALAVVEAPSAGSVGFMQHDIAGCWWIGTDRLLAAGLIVVEVPPSNLKQYATGSGATTGKNKVTKPMIVKAVNDRYNVGPIRLLPGQHNQADAIVLAAIGARLLGFPADPHIPAPNLRALTKIRLPEGLTSGTAT